MLSGLMIVKWLLWGWASSNFQVVCRGFWYGRVLSLFPSTLCVQRCLRVTSLIGPLAILACATTMFVLDSFFLEIILCIDILRIVVSCDLFFHISIVVG